MDFFKEEGFKKVSGHDLSGTKLGLEWSWGLHGGTWKRTYKNRNKKTKIETNIATMIETNRKR